MIRATAGSVSGLRAQPMHVPVSQPMAQQDLQWRVGPTCSSRYVATTRACVAIDAPGQQQIRSRVASSAQWMSSNTAPSGGQRSGSSVRHETALRFRGARATSDLTHSRRSAQRRCMSINGPSGAACSVDRRNQPRHRPPRRAPSTKTSPRRSSRHPASHAPAPAVRVHRRPTRDVRDRSAEHSVTFE